jgi:hypothetical protein
LRFIKRTLAAVRAATPHALGCLLCLASLSHADSTREDAADTLVVRYPTLTNVYSQMYNHDYFLEILHLALSSYGHNYRVETVLLPEFRSEVSLAKGLYDVHWLHTNRQREARLRPIRIPLFQGMIGWRLLLIKEQDQERFAAIDSVDELKALRAVQGHDWPDTPILQQHGFSVVRSASWEGMFKMLSTSRIDYFPRAATEIRAELTQFPDLGLAVEKSLALHYPSAYYFFVAPENEELAYIIEKGLNIAIANGSFDQVFMTYFGADIKRMNLGKRTIMRLENPLLPPQTPLGRAELWLDPLRLTPEVDPPED